MKTIVSVSLLLLAACNTATEPEFQETPQASQLSIAGLKALCDGRSALRISQDATIHGQVVANDLYGEFSREIILQDDSGGIAIAVDGDPLVDRFPFGTPVEVRCNGLWLTDYGGKVGLGTEPDEYGSGTIPQEEIERYFSFPETAVETPRATRLAFEEVGSLHIDTRVRFEGVRFVEAGKPWCDTDPETGRTVTTEREIMDANGARFLVRTLGNCDYAEEPLPSGSGMLGGVIDYFGGKYALRVTFREVVFSDETATTARYQGGGSAKTETKTATQAATAETKKRISEKKTGYSGHPDGTVKQRLPAHEKPGCSSKVIRARKREGCCAGAFLPLEKTGCSGKAIRARKREGCCAGRSHTTKNPGESRPGCDSMRGRASRYRCSASQSMSFRVWMFRPETEEMKTDGTPSGRCDRISAINSSSSMSHFVMASSRSLSSSSGLYWVSSPSRMS